MADTPRRLVAGPALQRVRSIRRRLYEHQHRLSDWGWAAVLFPFTMLGQTALVPGLLAVDGPASTYEHVPSAVQPFLDLVTIVGVSAAVSLAVLWRRSHPTVLLGTALAAQVLFGNLFAALLAVYSYAAWFLDRRRLLAWTGAFAVLFAVQWWLVGILQPNPTPTITVSALVSVLLFALPLGFGLWVGTRRRLIATLRERAARLEREQQLMAQRAAAEERERIAREMHDVVAHRVSLIVLHAGGLSVATSDERAAATAETIRTTGREALNELRGVLGGLHASRGAPTAPQPTLQDVDRLLQEWRDAGMSIQRLDTGAPLALSVAVQRTAYRILQEGLTNAAKHAPGAEVTVHLDAAPQALTLRVANGPPPRSGSPPPSSGHGLAGMAERASLAGGELASGPTPDGGWQLRAVLPVREPEHSEV